MNFISYLPEELLVDLAGLEQVLNLLETTVAPGVEDRSVELDPVEDLPQLGHSLADVPVARETGQSGVDLGEVDPVIAGISPSSPMTTSQPGISLPMMVQMSRT